LLSGKLNTKIIIQKPVEIKNSIGEDITSWSDFSYQWANIAPLSGREYLSNNELRSSVTHRIFIRFIKGVDSSMRIKHGSRIFDIDSIINTDERSRELVIIAEEVL